MRDYLSTCEFITALVGRNRAAEATEQTAIGNSIDTRGFKDMLAVIMIGNVYGTSAALATFEVTFQEAATADASDFADISDGAYTGTLTTGNITIQGNAIASVNESGQYQKRLYERLNDGIRKRWIRCHVSITGTAGNYLAAEYGVGVVMSRAVDTGLYILSPTFIATNNAEFDSGFRHETL